MGGERKRPRWVLAGPAGGLRLVTSIFMINTTIDIGFNM